MGADVRIPLASQLNSTYPYPQDCQVMKPCRTCIEIHGDGDVGGIDDYTLQNNVSTICNDLTDENHEHECGKCGDVFCPDCHCQSTGRVI